MIPPTHPLCTIWVMSPPSLPTLPTTVAPHSGVPPPPSPLWRGAGAADVLRPALPPLDGALPLRRLPHEARLRLGAAAPLGAPPPASPPRPPANGTSRLPSAPPFCMAWGLACGFCGSLSLASRTAPALLADDGARPHGRAGMPQASPTPSCGNRELATVTRRPLTCVCATLLPQERCDAAVFLAAFALNPSTPLTTSMTAAEGCAAAALASNSPPSPSSSRSL